MDQASVQWQRHRAARTVALHAHDAAEAAQLLDMLGLDPAEGRHRPRAQEPAPHPVAPTVREREATRQLRTVLLADAHH